MGGGWGVIGFVQAHFKAIERLNFEAHDSIRDQRQVFLFFLFSASRLRTSEFVIE